MVAVCMNRRCILVLTALICRMRLEKQLAILVSAKTLPTDLSIHYLGLNQAQWQTLIMMYARDVVSTYAGNRIVDIYHTLMSTSAATHECSAKDIATIKAWRDKLFHLIDVGVPGMPALCTPASQARSMERSGDDYTKLLVPVIPDLVPVRDDRY